MKVWWRMIVNGITQMKKGTFMVLPIGTGLHGSINNLMSHIQITRITIPIKLMTTMMILIGTIILSLNPNIETQPKIIIILRLILPRLISNRHHHHPLHLGNNTLMLIKMAHESSHTISPKEEWKNTKKRIRMNSQKLWNLPQKNHFAKAEIKLSLLETLA